MNKKSRRLSRLLTDLILVAPAKRFLFARQALLYATEKVYGPIGDPCERPKERCNGGSGLVSLRGSN